MNYVPKGFFQNLFVQGQMKDEPIKISFNELRRMFQNQIDLAEIKSAERAATIIAEYLKNVNCPHCQKPLGGKTTPTNREQADTMREEMFRKPRGQKVFFRQYCQGWDRRRYDLKANVSDNPYERGSIRWHSWLCGWEDCEEVNFK